MQKTREYALSLKQPWATLVVHGLKTVEVRRWPTARRGRILIHAARIPDERAQGWDRVPEPLKESAHLLGGILGAAEIVACRHYRKLEEFVKDQDAHLNEPGWFEAAGLFGFAFEKPEVLPFRKYPGWMRFFPVEPGSFVRGEQRKAP
jgi:hypothetical protein